MFLLVFTQSGIYKVTCGSLTQMLFLHLDRVGLYKHRGRSVCLHDAPTHSLVPIDHSCDHRIWNLHVGLRNLLGRVPAALEGKEHQKEQGCVLVSKSQVLSPDPISPERKKSFESFTLKKKNILAATRYLGIQTKCHSTRGF